MHQKPKRKSDITSHRTLRARVLAWYRTHGRDLPWRETRDPYAVWVSEIMLQQTQVDTVVPYYRAFMSRFPTMEALAVASLEEVLKAWENLGYYARARHLHAAARAVVSSGDGFPDTWEALSRLPGIGPYTAGAVLSIAFGRPYPAVDGNVRRVMSRFFGIRRPLEDPGVLRLLEERARLLVPRRNPGRFNQALMDLGAMVCTPRKPACRECPVRLSCRSFEAGFQEEIPVRHKRRAVPRKQMTAAVARDRSGRFLMVRRPEKGLLAGLWGFPGGEVQAGEGPEEGVARSVREALGIHLRVVSPLGPIEHAYTHFRITLHAYECVLKSGRPPHSARAEWRWTGPVELERLSVSRADRKVLQLISRHLQGKGGHVREGGQNETWPSNPRGRGFKGAGNFAELQSE